MRQPESSRLFRLMLLGEVPTSAYVAQVRREAREYVTQLLAFRRRSPVQLVWFWRVRDWQPPGLWRLHGSWGAIYRWIFAIGPLEIRRWA